MNRVDPRGLYWGESKVNGAKDKLGDAVECGLNQLDCVDPRQLAEPLIDRLPEGTGRSGLSIQLEVTCLQYPEACAAAAGARYYAEWETGRIYGDDVPEGTNVRPKEGDAFTHCFWSGLTTLAVGAGRAENITTRYDAPGSANPDDERDYDIQSNKRGREFAQYFGANSVTRGAGTAALRSYCQGRK